MKKIINYKKNIILCHTEPIFDMCNLNTLWFNFFYFFKINVLEKILNFKIGDVEP